MLVIRYKRIGKRNRPQYKIVVAEKSSSIQGKFVETLGSHDPHSKKTSLNVDRIKNWIEVGAQCSDSVYNLFVSKGVIEGKKRKVRIKKKKSEDEPVEEKKKKSDEEKKENGDVKTEESEKNSEDTSAKEVNKDEDKKAVSSEAEEDGKTVKDESASTETKDKNKKTESKEEKDK